MAAEFGEGPWASATLNPGRTRTDMRRQAVPDEDPSKLPAPETVAKAFVEVVTRWMQGAETNGRAFGARDLVEELTVPSEA